jgi:Fe-S-cluster containining protein
MSDSWYKDGLRFTCTRCGKCCGGAPGYVWVNAEEIRGIAEYRGEPVEELRDRFTRLIGIRRSLREKPDGECVFYDKTAGCTVYPARPRQCRTWPFWATNVKTPENWEHTCEICPGSGHGELISAEEITRRLQVIKL